MVPFFDDEEYKEDDVNNQGGQPPPLVAPGLQQNQNSNGGAGSKTKQKGSGRWTNLENYLSQNSGEALSSDITNRVGGQFDQAANKLNQTKTDFSNAVGSSRVDVDQSTLEQVRQNPLSVDKDKFFKMKNANYQGPMGLTESSSFQEFNKDFNKGKSWNEALQNETGRGTLLNEFYGRPSYSSGQNKLDQLIIQNNPSAKSQFATLKPRWSELESVLETSKTETANQAQGAKATTDEAKSLAQAALDESKLNLRNKLEDKINQYRTEGSIQRNQVFDDLNDDTLNDLSLDTTGLASGSNLYDLNLQDYVNQYNPERATMTNVASLEDLAQHNALKELMGGIDPGLINDPEQVGSYSHSFFDKDQMRSDLNTRQQAVESVKSEVPGLAQSFAWAANNVSSAFPPEWAAITTPEEAKAVLASPQGQFLLQWSKDRVGSNAAQPMLQLEQFVQRYDALRPDRKLMDDKSKILNEPSNGLGK